MANKERDTMKKLKVVAQQNMIFKNKWLPASAVPAGIAFFFLIFYYLGTKNILDIGFGELLFCFILPVVLLGAYIVMLRVMNNNVTLSYGLLGMLLCLYLLVYAFSYTSVLRMVAAIIWYIIAGVICVGTTMGFIKSNIPFIISFFAPAAVRFLFVDIGLLFSGSLLALIPEISAICGMVTFGMFGICLKATPIQSERKRA